MIRVKLEIFPPLAEKLVPGHYGRLTAWEEVHDGASLRELLLQLSNGRYRSLVAMTYDFEAEALTTNVLLIVNDEAVGTKTLGDTVLKNGDRVCFLASFSGGGGVLR
jgi:molybdopterin converting factor small subunit